MSSYVARRIGLLADAVRAIDARQDPVEQPLRATIIDEQSALSAADAFDTSDRSAELTLLAWLRGLAAGTAPGAAAALAALNVDPVSQALRQPVITKAADADAVMQLRQQHPLTLADVASIQAALSVPGAFDELMGSALHERFAAPVASRPYLYRDVAVLMPLRLETIFEQDPTGWTMLLRMVPDEASIRRDDPLPTAFEIESLRSAWQATLEDLSAAQRALPLYQWLDTPRARQEWQRLSTRFGPDRAAWLVSAHLPTINGDAVVVPAAAVRDRSSPNRVGGFPPRIEIWWAFGNDAPTRVDVADIDPSALVFDVVGTRAGDDGTPVHERDRWWISWQAAQDVGLGRIIRLPNGQGPTDLRLLQVVGLGDEQPEKHFRAQIESGELALLPLGAPTNAVDGRQAASLGHDEADWLRVAQRRMRNRVDASVDDPMLSRSLAGSDAALPAFPRGNTLPDIDRLLVGALWPALWGHQMRDLWGCVDEADRLAQWAAAHLRPEGLLPPIRIGEQAYALLPTTALRRWRVSPEEGVLARQEQRMIRTLGTMRDQWRDAARQGGTTVGADTARLLELIGRDALSPGYGFRPLLPAVVLQALYAGTTGIDPQRFDDWIASTFKVLHDVLRRGPGDPPGIREYLALGAQQQVTIPLVTPTQWPQALYLNDGQGHLRLDRQGAPVLAASPERSIAGLLETIIEFGHDIGQLQERWLNLLPDSLMIRLAIESNLLSAAACVQANQTGAAPLLEPLVAAVNTHTQVGELAAQYDVNAAHADPAGTVRRIVLDSLVGLMKLIGRQPAEARVLEQVERALKATLDTATHRIDPWINGMSARRLEHLRELPQTRFRMGVYGWLDGPFAGKPGPTSGGLLHAPSHAQALTAVILRDRFISEGLETPAPPGGRNLWSMQLESRSIRLADEIADEVRLGSHLYEVIGRQVERIAADGSGPITAVDTVRKAFPMHPDRPDRAAVCNGIDALRGLLDAAMPPITISAAQREQLQGLRTALDTYGDLLVAEAVHQVVTGHADIAGAAMDAAAGLASAPTLAFTRAPVAGDGLASAVLFAIPFDPAEDDPQPGASPAAIADGSVPSLLKTALGTAPQWSWARADANGGEAATVTLAELGLEPIDTVVISPETLDDMIRFWLGVERDVELGGTGVALARRAGELVAVIGGQPALLRDIAPLDEAAADAAQTSADDSGILAELQARYAVLRQAAQALIDGLTAAVTASDDAAMRRRVFDSMRWGIRPMLDRAQQQRLWKMLFDAGAASDAALLRSVAEQSRDALRSRLAAAPAADTREPIARKLAELAAPDGQLAILSRIDRSTLVRKTRIDTSAPSGDLDAQWLTVVAAVRAPLARLEALQLRSLLDPAAGALQSWSNADDDIWRTKALTALRQRRDAGVGSETTGVVSRLVVSYTLGDVWRDAGGLRQLAVGLVDSWTETAPRPSTTTTAAFGFNAPTSRPPQAILLAVPPTIDAAFGTPMTTSDLVEIVGDTRDLAHARAVDWQRLDTYLSVVPTTMLPASGRTAVQLDKSTTFAGPDYPG